MKKLLYLGIVLMFVSCGSDAIDSTASNESESAVSNESESYSNESESTAPTVNVDGKEFSTIKIGDLEVMTEDLEEPRPWSEAKKACDDLGHGWRLPTKDELNLLYENKEKIGIGGFANDGYWSSTENDDSSAWGFSFFLGNANYFSGKDNAYGVRAVRAF